MKLRKFLSYLIAVILLTVSLSLIVYADNDDEYLDSSYYEEDQNNEDRDLDIDFPGVVIQPVIDETPEESQISVPLTVAAWVLVVSAAATLILSMFILMSKGGKKR